MTDLGEGFLYGIGKDLESPLCVDSGFALVVKLGGECLRLFGCRDHWFFFGVGC